MSKRIASTFFENLQYPRAYGRGRGAKASPAARDLRDFPQPVKPGRLVRPRSVAADGARNFAPCSSHVRTLLQNDIAGVPRQHHVLTSQSDAENRACKRRAHTLQLKVETDVRGISATLMNLDRDDIVAVLQ